MYPNIVTYRIQTIWNIYFATYKPKFARVCENNIVVWGFEFRNSYKYVLDVPI